MRAYLLDTDICIFFLQGKYQLSKKVEEVGIQNCHVSEITIAELIFGAENSQDQDKHFQQVAAFEKSFKIIPIYNILRVYAREKVRLRKAGTPLAEFDLLIGSTALAHDLVMVTGNEKHFEKIDGIRLENWTKEKDNTFLRHS